APRWSGGMRKAAPPPRRQTSARYGAPRGTQRGRCTTGRASSTGSSRGCAGAAMTRSASHSYGGATRTATPWRRSPRASAGTSEAPSVDPEPVEQTVVGAPSAPDPHGKVEVHTRTEQGFDLAPGGNADGLDHLA